jgi:hypothetical protein
MILMGVIPITGFVTGMVLASSCDGHYCNQSIFNCSPSTLTGYDEVCCVDLDGDGISHCSDCKFDWWWCGGTLTPGPAYSCSYSGGAQCF